MLLKQAQLSAARSHKLSALLQESDADGRGGYTSHFELYMEAMQQAGADVGLIRAYVAALAEGTEARQALRELGAPLAVQHFVQRLGPPWTLQRMAQLPRSAHPSSLGEKNSYLGSLESCWSP